MIRAIVRLDLWLLMRVFMPAAHWVDYRFHMNQYDLAGAVLSAGLAMNFAANIESWFTSPKTAWLGTISSICLLLAYGNWLKRMGVASKCYERQPDTISREAAFFMIIIFPPLRLFMLVLGSFLIVPFILLAIAHPVVSLIVDAVTSPWMIAIGIALYLAGGLPPTRDRKKRKAWDWPWLRLAASPTS